MGYLFLEETIKKCYIWVKGDDAVYELNHFKPELEYWLSSNAVLVLETEHNYVMLEQSRVYTIEKTMDIEEMASGDEWIVHMLRFEFPEDEFEPERPGSTCEEAEKHGDCLGTAPGNASWVHEEHTLFEGERIHSVEDASDGLLLVLDDFSIKIKAAPEEERIPFADSPDYYGYFYVYGFDRYLTKPCKCGGKGRLVRDFVRDYHVVCNSCKMGTWAGMNVIDAIWFWNIEDIPCDFNDTKLGERM